MRIGEIERRSGVPAKTIRYYEQIGVLPEPGRTPAGYRDYGEDAVVRLAFVRDAQAVGLTLGEIRSIVAFRDRDERPCAFVAETIRDKARQVDTKIAALERMRAELRRLERRARTLDPRDCPGDGFCHLIDRSGQRA